MLISALADRISRLVLARPTITVVMMLIAGGIAAKIASNLHFDTAFDALLAPQTPELLEVRALQKKAGGTVQLMIGLESTQGLSDSIKKERLVFAKKLVRTLEKQAFIRYADVEYPVDFLKQRALYFLSTTELKEIKERLTREISRAKARANPLYVDLDDEDDGQSGWIKDKQEGAYTMLKHRLESPDGRYLFIRVKPMGFSYDMSAGKILFDQIKATVDSLNPHEHHFHIRYAGALAMNQEQDKKMNEDLRRASIIALVLILLLMTVYVRKIAAPIVLVVPLLTGVAITLALVQLTIGQLNLVSGFLVSALLGLGIDYEIHLYLRYLEELDSGHTRFEAMQIAMQRTLKSNTTAALTTAAAFFSISLAHFRGFREYGMIAGLGVLITLSVTCVMLPPLAVLISRKGKRGLRIFSESVFRRRFAWPMVVTGSLILIFSLLVAPHVEWNSNFRQLRGTSEVVKFSFYTEAIIGGSLSPAAIHVKNVKQARIATDYLKTLAKDKNSGVQRVLSLASLLPNQMKEKQTLIAEMHRTLKKIASEKLESADRKEVEKGLELTSAKPWMLDDVPQVFKRPFQTVDDDGQFVIIWPRSEMVDEPEIVAWGQTLESIRKHLRQKGVDAGVLGENRIAAIVLKEMRDEAPFILVAASLAVLFILILDTRRTDKVILIAGALAVGVYWMLGIMWVFGLGINVFNMAVLATIIGLGLDNAVHIHHRYREEGKGSLPKVVATTGGASFLASATTAIGFGAAVTAHHRGIQSLGELALIGFTATFVSSTIFFPAVLRVFEGAQKQGVNRSEMSSYPTER